jgi:hypothetical protein
MLLHCCTAGNLGTVQGVLRYAKSWNPPQGCLRIVWEEMLEIQDTMNLADSEREAFTDECRSARAQTDLTSCSY